MALAYAGLAVGGPLDPSTLLPAGWDVAQVVTVADIRAIDPGKTVEIEISPDFQTISAFGHSDVIGNVPSIASQLDQAAQQYGSRVYAVVLLHKQEFNLLGIQVDSYRFVIYHTQFPALLVLVALPVVIAMVAVWLECQGQPLDQCGQMLQATAKDAEQSLCNIFGASCALSSLAWVLIGSGILGIGFAAVLFSGEFKLAERLGIKPPSLPAVQSPRAPAPRVSVGVPGVAGIGIAAGGSGGRGRH